MIPKQDSWKDVFHVFSLCSLTDLPLHQSRGLGLHEPMASRRGCLMGCFIPIQDPPFNRSPDTSSKENLSPARKENKGNGYWEDNVDYRPFLLTVKAAVKVFQQV